MYVYDDTLALPTGSCMHAVSLQVSSHSLAVMMIPHRMEGLLVKSEVYYERREGWTKGTGCIVDIQD